MSEFLTQEQLEAVVPRHLKHSVTPNIIKTVNEIISKTDLRDHYRENILGYIGVLKTGKFTVKQYLEAVRYVSYKLMGATNTEAYVQTFPDRYARLIKQGRDKTCISNYVVAYNKTQLVNRILEQSLIPVHLANADIHQEAINTLAELMRSARSEKVRSDSAGKLVDALKPPETTKIELDIGMKEDSAISDLRNTTLELVAMQKKMIKLGGMTVKQVAHSPILIEEGEVVEN